MSLVDMHRRDFCKRAGTATVGAVGLGAAATGTATAHPGSVPTVTTRGHFEVDFNLKFWDDGFYEDELREGHSEYDYDTSGEIPWNADELVVMAHGWASDETEAADTFETVERGLAEQGYDGEVVGFSYDADVNFWTIVEAGKWWAHYDVARRNGKKLANFLTDLEDRNPGCTVRLMGHSLGGQPVVNALQELDRVDRRVESASLLGAAIEEDEVPRGGEYAGAIARSAWHCHNYFKTDDQVLDKAYAVAQFDAAVGEEGADGTPASGYEDHDVTDEVGSHFDYYEPGGCLDRVVADFEV
jgi:pimeloyl-ACP methyl ester carboxylesterase